MKYILYIFFLIPQFLIAQEYKLVWSDEFDSNSLNEKTWTYELGNGKGGWGTGQVDYCTKKNVEVSDGTLKMWVRKQDHEGFNYTSGKINCKGKKYFKYGKLTARCKIPAGKGIGAAFWMLPQFEKYGWWPKSGEIDILETNGHQAFYNHGTIHYEQFGKHQYKGDRYTSQTSLVDEWHEYTLIWTEDNLEWLVDDNLFHNVSLNEEIDGRKPFNEDFFIIIGVGVGSQFSGKVIEDKVLPQKLECDYIRYYQREKKSKVISSRTSPDGTTMEIQFDDELTLIKTTDGVNPVSSEGVLNANEVKLKYQDNRTIQIKLDRTVKPSETLGLKIHSACFKNSTGGENEALDIMVANMTPGGAPEIYDARLIGYSTLELSFTKGTQAIAKGDIDLLDVFVNNKKVEIKPIEFEKDFTKWLITLKTPITRKDTVAFSIEGNYYGSGDGGMLKAVNKSYILNDLEPLPQFPCRLEAEDYTSQEGTTSEKCGDEGGGRNMAYIDPNDWLEYTFYSRLGQQATLVYRVSSNKSGAMFSSFINGKFGKMNFVPLTGDWQKYIEIQEVIKPVKGVNTIRIKCSGGGFNINWIDLAEMPD